MRKGQRATFVALSRDWRITVAAAHSERIAVGPIKRNFVWADSSHGGTLVLELGMKVCLVSPLGGSSNYASCWLVERLRILKYK